MALVDLAVCSLDAELQVAPNAVFVASLVVELARAEDALPGEFTSKRGQLVEGMVQGDGAG